MYVSSAGKPAQPAANLTDNLELFFESQPAH